MKICTDCGLPKEHFPKDKRNKDGLQGRCTECRSKRRKGTHKHNPKNNAYQLRKQLRHIEQLSDVYVIAELKRGTQLTTKDIRKHPELIELKRQVLINKRKIKDEKRQRTQREPYRKVQRVGKVRRPQHFGTNSVYRLCFSNYPNRQG